MRFRKQPVVIEAVQWLNEPDGDSLKNILALARNGRVTFAADGTADLIIETLEGDMRASVGDWIVRGVKGECYPVKPDVFDETYAPESSPSSPTPSELVPWIDRVVLAVAELPDRTSPDDWPEAMLVTADELRVILTAHPPASVPAETLSEQIEKLPRYELVVSKLHPDVLPATMFQRESGEWLKRADVLAALRPPADEARREG